MSIDIHGLMGITTMRNETRYAQLCRLEREEREFARSMYQWNSPVNVEWARSRDIAGSLSLREWCRRLEDRVRDAEAALANRQRAADFADEQPDVADERHDEQGSEPVVIRRRGGLHHAK